MPLTLSALGIVTLLCSAGPATRADRWGVVAATAGAYALPVVTLLVLGGGLFTLAPVPWFPVAFVPLIVAVATGWRAASRTRGRAAVPAAATAALSAAWLVVLAFEVARYPVVAVLLAAAGAAAVILTASARPRNPQPAGPAPTLA
jgi:hypothetical protein